MKQTASLFIGSDLCIWMLWGREKVLQGLEAYFKGVCRRWRTEGVNSTRPQ